ncbi:MAG TPA: BadF/BadG/BcrA/BcrD ATPase family protein [Candidatus Dormibacteraeota bacterium]|nr:BadF/BadG/BcrA/BcrD ATPase family protein [Candidatus Dormibacteraeota bacterium]
MRRPRGGRRRCARAADDDSGAGQIPAAVLGLDIGGSTSRARFRNGSSADVNAEGPGANVATLEDRIVDERLAALLHKLGRIQPEACCAGAAGAEVAEGRARLESLLHRALPESRIRVVHDARLVLAAAGLDSGIALIAGTGSVAYGRARDGREAQRGGWGWMIGDEGSAVWITREAARVVMARAEANAPIGRLGEAMLNATGTDEARAMVRELHSRREPMRWAELASTVFETAARDEGAREIVVRGGAALARLVDSLDMDGPVVLAGGLLLHQPALENGVRDALGRECVRLEHPPVEGAVRLAEEMLRA